MSKFNIGDKVTVNEQAPKFIREGLRLRQKRTIVDTYYDKEAKRHVYHIGDNRRGHQATVITSYPFRSYYLELAKKRKRGRPKEKRRYRRKNK